MVRQLRCLLLLLLAVCQHQQVSSRILQAASAERSQPLLVQSREPVVRNQGAAQAIPGQYIVVFKPEAGSLVSATERLMGHLQATAQNRKVTAQTSSVTSALDFSPIGLSFSDGISTITTGSSALDQTGGVVGIVARGVNDATAAAIQNFKYVEAVVEDLIVGHAAASCTGYADPQDLSGGVSSGRAAASNLDWPHPACASSSTAKVVWVGERCGSTWEQVEYKGIFAMDSSTGAVKKGNGRSCAIFPGTSTLSNNQKFGSCGVAPSLASDLPTCVRRVGKTQCVTIGTARASPADREPIVTMRLSLRNRVKCGSRWVTKLTYTGMACGPDRMFIHWNTATGRGGCLVERGKGKGSFKSNHELFGSCGSGPSNTYEQVTMTLCTPGGGAKDDQDPVPSNPAGLKRVRVAAGEQKPTGVAMIEAISPAGVVTLDSVPASHQVVVGIIDSGVDSKHPDLNYVGGVSWATPAADLPDDTADPGVDLYGHGTHVAGIIGARNQGSGVVGVSPGLPIYSLKALDGNGQGMLSGTLSAVKWVTAEGVKKHNIRVINLSLVAEVSTTSPAYASLVTAVCKYFKEASDAGAVITTAAGNFGSNIKAYLPAVCPDVATVTALDAPGNAAASWSNYADPQDAAQVAHVIAAPGTSILSTISNQVDPSGLYILGGTSMASPHVAAVAANCIMAGLCSAADQKTGAEMIATIRKAAKKRYQMGNYAKYNPQDSVSTGKFYGYLVWSKY